MCLIITTEQNAVVDENTLVAGIANNPDGIGAVWLSDGGVNQFYATADSFELLTEEFIDLYYSAIAGRQALIHFRFATQGDLGASNLHPFEIEDGVFLAHNGTLPLESDDGKSDTRLFVEWIEDNLKPGWWEDELTLEILSQWGGWSRFVVFDTTARRFYRFGEPGLDLDEGIWVSNGYSLKMPRLPKGSSKQVRFDFDFDFEYSQEALEDGFEMMQ